ncbi:MAG: hypothetical protein ACKVX9_05155, partial [Blastocatellia bacterium]
TVGGYSASSLPASGRHRKHQNKEFLQPPCLNLKIQGGTPNDFSRWTSPHAIMDNRIPRCGIDGIAGEEG